ncbi:MAG: hypothetical protein AAGA93_22250 [Actinomycetota bacterium]
MTLISLASQKGSPGTSMAALTLAAALRPGEGRRKLLLEADPSGGVLAIRYRLSTDPGLVTLAAAARAGLDADELWRHTRDLPGGLAAVVCPDGSDQVHSALAAAGAAIGRHLAERRDVDVIADLGRLVPGSPVLELAAESTALLMVARPTADQLQPAARRLAALRPEIRNLGWLLIGEKPHGPAEVEDTFGFPVVGVLADDRRSVEAIAGGAITRRVRRHPYVRSAVTVADTLRSWLSPLADATPDAGPDTWPDAGSAPPGDADRAAAPEPIDLTFGGDVDVELDRGGAPFGDVARPDGPPEPVADGPPPAPSSAAPLSPGFPPPPQPASAASGQPPPAAAPPVAPTSPGGPTGNGGRPTTAPSTRVDTSGSTTPTGQGVPAVRATGAAPAGHDVALDQSADHPDGTVNGGPAPATPPVAPPDVVPSTAPSPFVHEDAELDGSER